MRTAAGVVALARSAVREGRASALEIPFKSAFLFSLEMLIKTHLVVGITDSSVVDRVDVLQRVHLGPDVPGGTLEVEILSHSVGKYDDI